MNADRWLVPTPGFAAVGFAYDVEGFELLPEEHQAISASARPVRQESFRMGRKAAHLALDELGADSTRPVLVGTYRDPVWPHGIVGSITHTSDLAAALVAWADRTDGVGIDAEHIRHAPELEAHVPIVEERRWLDETEPSVRARELIALFSAKEAVFKAFYPRVGRFFGFDAASLRPARGGFRARLIDESLDVEYPPTRIFRVGSTWFGDTVLSWLLLPAPGR